MKNLKTYTIALLLIIPYLSFAQKITIDTENANVFLIVKEVKIALKQAKISKTNNNNSIKYKIDEDASNVICNVDENLKFLIKNTENKDLNIKIIKLDKKNNVQQNTANKLLNEVVFKTTKEKQYYTITIPKIEKGTYAIIINNSLTWNLFKIN
jgi:hypothetical protein